MCSLMAVAGTCRVSKISYLPFEGNRRIEVTQRPLVIPQSQAAPPAHVMGKRR